MPGVILLVLERRPDLTMCDAGAVWCYVAGTANLSTWT